MGCARSMGFTVRPQKKRLAGQLDIGRAPFMLVALGDNNEFLGAASIGLFELSSNRELLDHVPFWVPRSRTQTTALPRLLQSRPGSCVIEWRPRSAQPIATWSLWTTIAGDLTAAVVSAACSRRDAPRVCSETCIIFSHAGHAGPPSQTEGF